MNNPWHPRGPNGAPGNPAHGPHAGQDASQRPHGHAPAPGPAHGSAHGQGHRPPAGQPPLPPAPAQAAAQPPYGGPAQAPYGGPRAPLPQPGPYAQQPMQPAQAHPTPPPYAPPSMHQAQAHPTPPPYARQPAAPHHRPAPPHVPDPTVIVMRQRRPRGLIISVSVLVTLGLVIGGVLALSKMEEQSAAGNALPPASAGAGSDGLAAATAPGAAGAEADGAAAAMGEPAELPGDSAGNAPADDEGNTAAEADGAAATAEAAAQADDEPGDPATDAPSSAAAVARVEPPDAPERGKGPAARSGRASARTGGRAEAAAPREPEHAWLALTIAPDSAAVTVDGDTYRGSALQRVGPLEAGSHTIRVTAPGHEPLEQIVVLAAGETERLSLALAPTARGPGKVRIRSTPAGASVVIDGRVRGITPVTLDLASGKAYELTLSHTGYETWRTVIEPEAGKRLEVETTLMRRPGSEPVAAAPDSGKQERDIAVPASMVGDADRGRALYERCRNCHGSKSSVTPRSQTRGGWTRFLASRRHARHAELRSAFTVSELADVKAFLLENAADVKQGMAAGVR